MKQDPAPFFSKEVSQVYDQKNRGLAPIADGMHFLIRLILQDFPAQARVLCVGVGTGAEILSLAAAHPGWTFVGVDPAEGMLDVCRERLQAAGLEGRFELVHGYVHDVNPGEAFDVVLSVLVAHFVRCEDRLGFFEQMTKRLRTGGCLINTEISYDLNCEEFPSMVKNWERVQALMGATPEMLAKVPQMLREALTVLSNAETEDHLRRGGIAQPVRFFQALMISGWYGFKTARL